MNELKSQADVTATIYKIVKAISSEEKREAEAAGIADMAGGAELVSDLKKRMASLEAMISGGPTPGASNAKASEVAKTFVILQLKPRDEEADMEAMLTSVKTICMLGLVWDKGKNFSLISRKGLLICQESWKF